MVSSVWLQPRLHGVDVLLGALIGEPQSLELVLDVGQLRLKLPRFHRVLMWMFEWTNQLSLFSGQVINSLPSDGGAAHLSRECLGRSHFLAKVLVLDQQVGPLLLEESHLRRRKTVRDQLDGEGSALSQHWSKVSPESRVHDTSEPRSRRRAGSPSSTQSSSSEQRHGRSTPLREKRLVLKHLKMIFNPTTFV